MTFFIFYNKKYLLFLEISSHCHASYSLSCQSSEICTFAHRCLQVQDDKKKIPFAKFCKMSCGNVGICCPLINPIPVVVSTEIVKPNSEQLDFGLVSNLVIQRAFKIGESFAKNLTQTKNKLRPISDKKSSEYKHSAFLQQSPGVEDSGKLAMMAMTAAKTLLLEMKIGDLNFVLVLLC